MRTAAGLRGVARRTFGTRHAGGGGSGRGGSGGRRRQRWCASGAALTLVAGTTAYLGWSSPAGAASGQLPGGSSFSLTVGQLTDGEVLPPGVFNFGGAATIGFPPPTPTTTLVYTFDISRGSTENAGTGGPLGAPCSGSGETIMTCEQRYARDMNQLAIFGGGVGSVGAVAYGTFATTADVSPKRGRQIVNGPAATNPLAPDILSVIAQARSEINDGEAEGGFQAFENDIIDGEKANLVQGIQTSLQVANAGGMPNTIVMLMSTGHADDASAVPAALDQVPSNVHFWTFAIGKDARCAGVLQQIADRTGGKCVAPKNDSGGTPTGEDGLGTLPDLIDNLSAGQLDSISATIDGNAVPPDQLFINDVNNSGLPLPLPARAPVTASWNVIVRDLATGRSHTLCATATGSDPRGPASLQECRTVIIDVPPTADPGGPYSGLQGAQVPITGTATDPDTESLSTLWSVTPGEGVDPTAKCTIAEPESLSTTVSCDRPGQYTLTLRASDVVAPPVSAGTTLTISNVPPVTSAGGPYTGTAGMPTALAGTVTDTDSPDLTVTWSVAPRDQTPPPADQPPAGQQPSSQAPGSAAPPPGESSAPAAGPTDGPSDGPTDGPGDGGGPVDGSTDPNACAFTDPTILAPQITCPQPGTYTLTLTANDGDNEPVSATTTLTVVPAHVPVGSLSLAASAGPTVGYAGGDPITVTYTVRNDGELPMPGVRLTTALPPGLSRSVPEPAVLTPPGPRCTAGTACDLGTLQPGQRRTVRFQVVPSAKVDAKIRATLTTTGADATAADNATNVRIRVLQPTLVVDPTVGPTGMVAHVVGTDFPAGARVQLAWSVGLSQLPGQLVVARDGTFTAQALVFSRDQEGPRDLIATFVRGTRFGPVTSNSYLVAKRPLEPPFDPANPADH
jgi:Domain of unknown function DUF11